MAYEHAPWRKRGKYSAIPTAGNPLGVFLANVVFLVAVNFDSDWAWRVPFLASSVLIIAGIIIRAKLNESPEFEEAKERGEIEKNPITKVIRKDWRNLLRVIGLRLVESAGFYIIVTYVLNYVTENGHADRSTALLGLCIGTALGVGTSIMFGSLTDRFGRKPIYIIGCLLTIAFGFPMFLLLNSGVAALIILVYVIGLPIIHDMLAGTQGAWFSDMFPPGTRNSGASMGYQFAAAISGFVPFTAAALAAQFGWGGVAALYCGAGVLGLLAVLVTRETWGAKDKAAVDAYIEHGTPITNEKG